MHVTVEPLEGFVVLHLGGDFDSITVPKFQKEIDTLQAGGEKRIALNLRLLRLINSAALGAILKVFRDLKSQDGELVIAQPSKFCRDIIQKVGLDQVIPIYESNEEAGQALLGVE